MVSPKHLFLIHKSIFLTKTFDNPDKASFLKKKYTDLIQIRLTQIENNVFLMVLIGLLKS